MARTPNKNEVALHEGSDMPHEAVEAATILATVQTEYNDDRDLANQILGQAQMARSIAKFADVVGLTKLKEIKERKLYRALKGKKAIDHLGNEIPDVGTWDGFCKAVGTSANKVDEDLINLRVFGEEAMENLSRIGAGYRELRQFRKLPDDQKTALIEVAKEGDKDTLLELAEDLIAKHSKEKEEITQRLTSVEADLESSRQRVSALKTARDSLEDKLNEERFKPITDNALAERNRLEATSISSKIVRELMGSLRSAFTELEKDSSDRGVDHSSFMAGLVCEVRNELDDIATRFSIDNLETVAAKPEWLASAEPVEG